MILRPHHLLCTMAFRGLGYSADFTENMTKIVDTLDSGAENCIKITFDCDDICVPCPSRHGNGCIHKSVRKLDRRGADILSISEGKYTYNALLGKMRSHLNEQNVSYICGCCSWFNKGICLEHILAKSCSANCMK